MNIHILKDNRNEIIEMINNKKSEQISLKDAMSKVAEYAQMGCYFGMEDMEDIISDAIQELEDELMRNLAKQSMQFRESNKKRAIELLNIM